MGNYLPFVNLGTTINLTNQIRMGGRFSMALSDSGELKIWGQNNKGCFLFEKLFAKLTINNK